MDTIWVIAISIVIIGAGILAWRKWGNLLPTAITTPGGASFNWKKGALFGVLGILGLLFCLAIPPLREVVVEQTGMFLLGIAIIVGGGVARSMKYKGWGTTFIIGGCLLLVIAAVNTWRPVDHEIREDYFAKAVDEFQEEVGESPDPRYRGEVFFTEFACTKHADDALEIWIGETSTSYLSPDSIRVQAKSIQATRCKKKIVATSAEEELFLEDLEEVTSLEEARVLYRSIACERNADRAQILAFEKWAEYYIEANKARKTRTELLNEVQAQAKLLREQVCSKEELPAVKWEEAPYQKVSYNHTLFVGNDGFTRNGLPKCSLPTGEEVPPIVTHILLFKPDLKKGDEIKVYDERTAPRSFAEYCKTLPRQIPEIWLYHKTAQSVYVYTTCEGVKGSV